MNNLLILSPMLNPVNCEGLQQAFTGYQGWGYGRVVLGRELAAWCVYKMDYVEWDLLNRLDRLFLLLLVSPYSTYNVPPLIL